MVNTFISLNQLNEQRYKVAESKQLRHHKLEYKDHNLLLGKTIILLFKLLFIAHFSNHCVALAQGASI